MSPPDPVEIELKLALPPEQAALFQKLMARRRSAPVQQVLLTRYFDTPDLALSMQGVALRVRKIGRRWLQTLKTEGERQGGLSRRAEYEMAISNGKPDWNRFPAAALVWVPEALRAQLIPVFETHFTRTAWLVSGRGGAKIEVALDAGEVRTLKGIKAGTRSRPICEIELELKAGQPDALLALALGWAGKLDYLPLDVSKAERGARLARNEPAMPAKAEPLALHDDMSVEDGFVEIAQACLTQFQANLPGVLAPLPNLLPQAGEGANVEPQPIIDIEYVHQARVALRRLRALLHLVRGVCAVPDELQAGLRAWGAALGPVRDWDVLCSETLPAIAPHYIDAEAWQFGLGVLETRRTEARVAMRAAIRQQHPGAWLLAFQRWLMQQGWRDVSESGRKTQLSSLKKWARRKLEKRHRSIARAARDYAQMRPEQRHALRIAVKRQRYAAEFFQSLFSSRRQARYQTALQDVQDSLGQLNDRQVASRLLSEAGEELGPMGGFALGWLAGHQTGSGESEIAKQLKNFVKSTPSW